MNKMCTIEPVCNYEISTTIWHTIYYTYKVTKSCADRKICAVIIFTAVISIFAVFHFIRDNIHLKYTILINRTGKFIKEHNKTI